MVTLAPPATATAAAAATALETGAAGGTATGGAAGDEGRPEEDTTEGAPLKGITREFLPAGTCRGVDDMMRNEYAGLR